MNIKGELNKQKMTPADTDRITVEAELVTFTKSACTGIGRQPSLKCNKKVMHQLMCSDPGAYTA